MNFKLSNELSLKAYNKIEKNQDILAREALLDFTWIWVFYRKLKTLLFLYFTSEIRKKYVARVVPRATVANFPAFY